MKQYTIQCSSITGAKGKHLTKGNSYAESEFINLKEHLENGHISETKEVAVVPDPPAEEVKKEKK